MSISGFAVDSSPVGDTAFGAPTVRLRSAYGPPTVCSSMSAALRVRPEPKYPVFMGTSSRVRVTSPPEGGRANDEVKAILEGLIGAKVVLVRGMTSRHKVFQVASSGAETVLKKLGL